MTAARLKAGTTTLTNRVPKISPHRSGMRQEAAMVVCTAHKTTCPVKRPNHDFSGTVLNTWITPSSAQDAPTRKQFRRQHASKPACGRLVDEQRPTPRVL